MRKQVYSLLVDNNPGVLSRIAVCSAEEDTVSTVLQPERRQIRDLPELQWWHPETS